MITGRVHIDLTADPGEDWSLDRRKLSILEQCPDGAEIVVSIGRRQYVTQDAAHWLHAHDARLSITIEGSRPDAVLSFVRAARAGDWSAVA